MRSKTPTTGYHLITLALACSSAHSLFLSLQNRNKGANKPARSGEFYDSHSTTPWRKPRNTLSERTAQKKPDCIRPAYTNQKALREKKCNFSWGRLDLQLRVTRRGLRNYKLEIDTHVRPRASESGNALGIVDLNFSFYLIDDATTACLVSL